MRVTALDGPSAAARLLGALTDNTALNRVAALAARLLSCASSQVSLLTDVQTVAGGWGLPSGTLSSEGPLADSLCTVTAASGGPLVVGDAGHDDRVQHLPPVRSGAVGAYLGVPLVSPEGATFGALCVFDPSPRVWSAYDVALLEELAGAAMADLELAAVSAEFESSRMRWDVALEAAGIGGFDWDLRTDRVDWDERLQALFGYAPGEFVPHLTEAFRRVDPDDRAGLEAAIAAAVQTCGDYRADFRVNLPDGRQRWIAARGRATAGRDGRAIQVLGAAYDITDVRTAKDEAARLLATMATGFAFVNREWQLTYINSAGSRVVGMSADELVGRSVWEAFPGLEDSEFGVRYRHAMHTGETVEIEAYYAHLDSWYAVRGEPGADGLSLHFLDISERHRADARAESANARLALLARVSAELSATLEAETGVAKLAQLVVPILADWCIVTLVSDKGTLRDVGAWHADEAMREVVERYATGRLAALGASSFLARAARTGETIHVANGAHAAISELLVNDTVSAPLDLLRPESVTVLPLRARGRTVGIISLFGSHGRPSLTDDDLAVAEELALRAGLALDNARLYEQQRTLAEGLQRSLLTAPPEPDHCEIVVRYVPAAEIASVGGDWFDSFLQPGGATMLVIGDVVGHDTEAAAAMGQLRGLLRGIAWHSGAGPADVLSGLDAAMQGLQVHTIATAVVARLEQTPDERERDVTHLRWSNAGHPPPMAIDPDGSVLVLGGQEADLLLGIDPHTRRTDTVVTLHRGSTVVLYTDGLVERRGQSLDDGLSSLRATLAEIAHLPLDALCDELLARMLPARAEDDVAMVAVRLHRQDVPRPAEAGPVSIPPEVPADPT